MAEYIDKQSVYKEACAGCTCHGDEIGSCFSSEPCERLCFVFASANAVEVPPVVRCKECKHCYEAIDSLVCAYGPCVDCTVPEDFYCKYGEREEK